jgi:23S rRNA pseudouridine2605 synthase
VSEPVKVHKAIADAGLMSRRAGEDLIRQGRVTVDGRKVTLGERVDPEVAVVEVDGHRIPVAPGRITYLLNKPLGVISTAADTHGRPTVVELVPAEPRVWPVGRLDVDSEGLLLMSNDGELTNRVTHPSHGVTKTYAVLVTGQAGAAVTRRLVDGVELDDGPARAVSARVLDRQKHATLLEIVLNEGRNREIRRMCDVVGHPVERLVRTAIGGIRDRTLKPGEWRLLEPTEVAALYHQASPGESTRPEA